MLSSPLVTCSFGGAKVGNKGERVEKAKGAKEAKEAKEV